MSIRNGSLHSYCRQCLSGFPIICRKIADSNNNRYMSTNVETKIFFDLHPLKNISQTPTSNWQVLCCQGDYLICFQFVNSTSTFYFSPVMLRCLNHQLSIIIITSIVYPLQPLDGNAHNWNFSFSLLGQTFKIFALHYNGNQANTAPALYGFRNFGLIPTHETIFYNQKSKLTINVFTMYGLIVKPWSECLYCTCEKGT